VVSVADRDQVSIRRRAGARSLAAVLLALALMAGCAGSDAGDGDSDGSIAGGAGDLPEQLPGDVSFRKTPRTAIPAPDFSTELIDGTPVTASDLWEDRPLVLVFTASWCDRCADVHRTVAETVDEHEGAIGLLAVVPEDDVEGARAYAQELQLGHPIAVGDDEVWLNYAADEPPLVALVAPGGKVLRGWPGGVDGEDLTEHLDKLFVNSANDDG
jgi:thiol-disulfide isomerase/thioredoxin